jgi:hypothetical protein
MSDLLQIDHKVLQKALEITKDVNLPDTGWVTGVANLIEQEEIQNEVARLVDYQNPLRQNMPRIPGRGSAFRFTTRTAGTTPAAFIGETTSDAIRSAGSRNRETRAFKTIIARGRIGRFSQAVGDSLLDLLGDELEARAEDYRDFEDLAMIQGDALANVVAYDGFDRLLGLKGMPGAAGTTYTNQVIYPTGMAPAVGATLTGNLMDQLVDKVVHGEPNMIVCSRAGRRALLKIIHAATRYLDKVEVVGGHKLPAWMGIPIFVSTNIPDVATTIGAGGTYLSYTGGTFTTIYCLSTENVFISELTRLTTMPLAQTSSQWSEFDMFSDQVLVYKKRGALSALSHINPALG